MEQPSRPRGVSEEAPRRRNAGRWSVALRVAVSALLLYYVFHNFRWQELWGHIRRADPVWIIAAAVFFAIPTALIGMRWWLLLRAQEVHTRLARILAYTCIGQFFNTFLLGSTGGDVMKVLYIVRDAPDAKVRAGMSILVDRAMGLVVLAAVAVGAASTEWALFTSQPELRRVLWALIGILAASAVGLALLTGPPLPRWLAALGLPKRLTALAESMQHAARLYFRKPRLLSLAAALSIMVHLTSMSGGYSLARAFGLNVGFAPMAVILATVFFVISVPVTISGHGLRESSFVLMFGLFGVEPSAAIAFSLTYFGLTLAVSLACGTVYLGFRRQEPGH